MPLSTTQAWDLASWDAVETLEHLARGDVSAAEVTDAALTRATDAAALNALVTPTFERARAAASAAPHGPLFGVPSAIKDLAHLAGVRIAWGSAGSGTYVSPRTDPTVTAFERTGLISIGKSSTPEIGLTATTEPLAFGPTHNPWARGYSSGGSSGGAAALVGAGVVPLALGSDGGGSVRIPASCCGVVGLKPTRGRRDMEGSNLLPVNIAVHGILTRTVRDTVAFWKALEQVSPPRKLAPIGDVAPAPARRLRLAVFTDSPIGTKVHPEVKAATEAAAALCVRLGHTVEAISCPYPAQAVNDFVRMWFFVAFSQVRGARLLMHRGFDPSKMEPLSKDFAQRFSDDVGGALAAIWRLRGFERTSADILARWDAVICPTLAEPPPPHGFLRTDGAFEETRDRLLTFTPFTGLLNSAGAPAISVPLGRSSTGLPLGVQFAAAHGAERLLLELASELEAAQPWPRFAPHSPSGARSPAG